MEVYPPVNVDITLEKPLDNHDLVVVQWDSVGFTWIYPLVIKHGWLENPQTEWRFLARKIIDKWSIFNCYVCLPEGIHVYPNKT